VSVLVVIVFVLVLVLLGVLVFIDAVEMMVGVVDVLVPISVVTVKGVITTSTLIMITV